MDDFESYPGVETEEYLRRRDLINYLGISDLFPVKILCVLIV